MREGRDWKDIDRKRRGDKDINGGNGAAHGVPNLVEYSVYEAWHCITYR